MKKIIAIIGITALLALAGCATKKTASTTSVTQPTVTTTLSVSTQDQIGRATADSAANSDQKKLICEANEFVTLRDAATTEGKELAKVKRGEEVTYISTEGDFLRVTYNGMTGYVMKGYFSEKQPAADAAGTNSTEPSAPVGSTAPTTANTALNEGDALYCVAEDGVILRESAARTAEELDSIDSREEVTYLETSGEWYKVEYEGETGYVLKKYFSPQADAPAVTD